VAIVPLLRWPLPAAALCLAFAAGAQQHPPGPQDDSVTDSLSKEAAGATPAEGPKKSKAARPAKARKGKPALTGALNLNRATEAELRLLPGIGKGRAKAIVERRPKAGYRTVEEVGRIKGLRGVVQKLKAKGLLTVDGPTTLRPAKRAGPAAGRDPPQEG
jgi:competence protein ComEA